MTKAREGRVKETESFETENLIIRRTRFEDLEQFYLWEQRPEVTEFFSIREGQTREEVYHKFFADEDNPSAEQFTILMKNGSPIGRIVLADIIPGWKAELWRIYIGDASLRGKGYGRQAMEAVMATALKICSWNGCIWTITPAIRQAFSMRTWAFSEKASCERTVGKTAFSTTST